ncbi:hypothetical protein Esti_001283 [Eimeria stiedai]
MWKSRQGLCAAAIREQQSLRKRDAFLAAALEVAAEQRQPQLVAEQATRSDAVAAMHILRRKTKEARQQLSSRLDERRLKLCLLFEDERGEENAALRRMQHSVGLKEQDIMSRAAALRRLRDEERKKQDDRMRAVKWQREHEHSLLQTSKLRLKEVVAANEAQIASKIRRQQKEKEAAAVFEALWTEDLNGKRLRERRIVTGKLKKLEQTKEALLDQIAKREETRQQEIQRLRAENELEIRRLHEESESAARQRQLEQGEKAKKRREMGNALAQQLTERHQLRLKDAALEQEQLEAQAKLGLKAKNRTQLMKTMEVANANHLMHQDKQKQMQELKEIEAQYTREQAAAEDCKTREVSHKQHYPHFQPLAKTKGNAYALLSLLRYSIKRFECDDMHAFSMGKLNVTVKQKSEK